MFDPELIGRSVVVGRGAPPPAPWDGCERVSVTAVSGEIADRLLDAWRARRPVVVELTPGLGLDDPATPPAVSGPAGADPWEWPIDLRLVEDDLHHAVWANAVDARTAEPSFLWAGLALARGCSPAPVGAPADVLLPDGRPAVCDGGPLDASLGERVSGATAVLHRVGLEHGRINPLVGTATIDFPLAPDQLAAVVAPRAGGRVIAPAGSGKTRVLTERARVLVEGWGVPPAALALVAYNVRAREELQHRLAAVAGVRVRTLNALSLRLAGDETTIDEREVRARLGTLVAVPRKADADPIAVWLEALTRVRLGLQDPATVEDELPDVAGLGDVVRLYRTSLARAGEVDFDEQVVRAIARLLGDPAFRRVAQRGARVLLVDEFQDLTPAHLLLLRLLSGPAGSVFAVGDDDQTIYGYAGASPRWLVDFQRWFPGSAEHALEVNYRCAPPVVDAASNLLTRNAVRVPKVIRARPGRVPSLGGLEVRAPTREPAQATAGIVRQFLAGDGDDVAPSDVAVLCRVNALLTPVQILLQHEGTPVTSPVDERFLTRSTVRASLAWCAVAGAENGSPAWRRLEEAARRPRRGMSESLRRLAGKQASAAELRSLAGWLESKGSAREAAKIEQLAGDVETIRGAAPQGTAALLRVLRDEVGLASSAAALDSWSFGNVSSHEDDLDALLALAHLQPDPGALEGWLRAELSKPPARDGVTLASVHAVKGREWPYVVVHHASEGQFPHRLVGDVEEERRVFHVAITRSSIETIVVPGASPSPFLAELSAPGQPPVEGAGRRSMPTMASRTQTGKGAKPKPPADDLGPEDRALFDALRSWRATVVRGTKKPAYTVFTDATLAQIASSRPADERALARVPGIGPTKLEQYADAVLAIVEEHR